jgi:hypothetical protein
MPMLDLMGKHSLDFWLSEDLPDPNNRVSINRDGEIILQYKPNNEEGHKRLIKKLESLMGRQLHHDFVVLQLFKPDMLNEGTVGPLAETIAAFK